MCSKSLMRFDRLTGALAFRRLKLQSPKIWDINGFGWFKPLWVKRCQRSRSHHTNIRLMFGGSSQAPMQNHARSYEVLHPSRKIISANLKIWGSKMQPLSGNQRPDLLTALMNMSLVPRLPGKMQLCRSSSNVPRLPSFLDTIPCSCHAKRHPNVQKWRETCGALYILTSKCASRHNGVRFLDISTSKSCPNVRCFLAFALANVLRATTACAF